MLRMVGGRTRTLKLAPPPDGWATVWTIQKVGGICNRTLRSWIEEGLVDRPEVRGVYSFYSPRSILQVRAIAHLRASGLRRRAYAAKVRGASDDALRAILGPPPAPATSAPATSAPATSAAGTEGFGGERWVHIALIPGVQLLVRSDATEFAVRTAEEICQRYAAR